MLTKYVQVLAIVEDVAAGPTISVRRPRDASVDSNPADRPHARSPPPRVAKGLRPTNLRQAPMLGAMAELKRRLIGVKKRQ